MTRYVGKVCWFSNSTNYGFLEWEIDGVKQTDLFVHYSDIVCEGFKTLKKDQQVSFIIGTNNRGQPKAAEVIIIS